MPWIDENKCTGCGICVEECPVSAINLAQGKAVINMKRCIRCGKCHDVCPQEAVRHDSERIPLEIEQNVKKIRKNMKILETKEEKEDLLEKMTRHYNKKIKVAKGTIEKINKIISR